MTDEKNLDAPTPPGGPQRTDAPQGSATPGAPDKDPGSEHERITKREGDSDREEGD